MSNEKSADSLVLLGWGGEERKGKGVGAVAVFAPVRLNENAVDLFEIDDADLIAHGFDERTQAQVAGAAQQSFAGTHDQGQRFGRKGIVCPRPARSN